MNNISRDQRIYISILFTIIFVHFLTLSSQVALNFEKIKPDEEEKIVIKLVNPNLIKEKAIVKTVVGKKQLVEDAFRGKDDNYVHRQVTAKESGVTKDAGQGRRDGTDKVSTLEKLQMPNVKVEKTLSNLSLSKATKKTAIKKEDVNKRAQIAKGIKFGNKSSSGSAKTSQKLDDIPLGDFNALNTSQYKNYSYNMRVRDRIEQLWYRAISDAVGNIGQKGRYLASEVHRTTLKIILNAKGKIIDVAVQGASGVKEFDESAIKSFNQAVAFPNPPKDMIKDGRVTLNWSFNVDASR